MFRSAAVHSPRAGLMNNVVRLLLRVLNGHAIQGVSSEDLAHYTRRFSYCRTHQQASTMCTVCQEEFRLCEHIRELRCTHQFHRRCIDRWLSSHSTCPLCVQPVVPPRHIASHKLTHSHKLNPFTLLSIV